MEKSIIDNLLEKATQTKFASSPRSSVEGGKGGGKDYEYNPEKQELSVSTFENGSQKRLDKRVLATTKENEKKLKNASIESDLEKSFSIDDLINKAVYGVGAVGGKLVHGTGKNPPAHGKVKKPELSEDRKKEILSGVKAKATSQASGLGLHKRAAEEASSKSLDERTSDMMKALNVDYGRRKAGSRYGDSRQDPDAGIDREKERKMDAEESRKLDALPKYEDSSKSKEHAKVPSKFFDKPEAERKRIVGDRAWKNYDEKKAQVGTKNSSIKDGGRQWIAQDKTQKSLDSDLNKDLREGYKKESIKQTGEDYDHKAEADYKQAKKVRDKYLNAPPARGSESAYKETTNNMALRERLAPKSLDERICDLMKDMSQQREREIHSAVSKVRMIKEDVPGAEKIDAKNDDVFRAVRTHNNIAAIRTQKSVCDTWMIESPFVSKGARVIPLGPGGEVQTLAKADEDEDDGAE